MNMKESVQVPALLFSWSVPVCSHAVTSVTLLKTLSRAPPPLSLSLSLTRTTLYKQDDKRTWAHEKTKNILLDSEKKFP